MPKLRFPEFRDADPWIAEPLGQLAEIQNERAGAKKLTLMSITAGVGLITQLEKFGREIAGNQYKTYFVLRQGDFAYNKSATKEYPEGFIDLHTADTLAAVPNSIFVCFRFKDNTTPQFFNYQFFNNLHGKWLSKFITIGARAHGSLNVDHADLLSLPVPLPPSTIRRDEQQKIANCLSSLDALIAAHADKLAALKTHKQGLLQQLFPRDGEAVPRLRFPEFRGADEWQEVALGEIAEVKLGKMLDSKKHAAGKFLPYLNNLSVRWNRVDTSDLPKMHFRANELDRYGLREGDVVVCEGGEPGRAAVWDGRLPDVKFQKAIHRVRFNVPLEPNLLVLYLESISGTTRFEKLFTGGGIKHLTRKIFAKLNIPLAIHEEQQKIADCLSSLDDLIAAQAARIDALKQHKQGLLQQLFPAMDEVAA